MAPKCHRYTNLRNALSNCDGEKIRICFWRAPGGLRPESQRRKGAKTQRKSDLYFLCVFAPLRLCDEKAERSLWSENDGLSEKSCCTNKKVQVTSTFSVG